MRRSQTDSTEGGGQSEIQKMSCSVGAVRRFDRVTGSTLHEARILPPPQVQSPHLLSLAWLLKLLCAQRRRHLEKSQLDAPAVFDRRAVRDRKRKAVPASRRRIEANLRPAGHLLRLQSQLRQGQPHVGQILSRAGP